MNKMKYKCEIAFEANKRNDICKNAVKPMEDYHIFDDKNNIFIVFDGVTRPHEEYSKKNSSAYEVSELFCNELYKNLLNICINDSIENIKKQIYNSAKKANEKVAIYNEVNKDLLFLPGTLGVMSMIINKKLYFGCIGDSFGTLLRDNLRIMFAEPQTFNYNIIFNNKVKKKELCTRDEKKIFQYNQVNHPDQKYSYGVINGDINAMDFFTVSHIDLYDDDVIILASDGLYSYINSTKVSEIKKLSANNIIESSVPYDSPPYNKYADDKTIIKIYI